MQFKVLREPLTMGKKTLSEGDIFEATGTDVQHLVDSGVIERVDEKAAEKPKNKAAQKLKNKAK